MKGGWKLLSLRSDQRPRVWPGWPSRRTLASGAVLAAMLGAACEKSPQQTAVPVVAAPAIPADVQGAARAALGSDGEALAWGDFPDLAGRQVLAVNRLAGGAPGAMPDASLPAAGQGETTIDVIRVSILKRGEGRWSEAFHADEHLKNSGGYLAGAPSVSVAAWRMTYVKTTDSGFRLSFTPLNVAPGTKVETVTVAWNPKSKQYEALDASGKRFLGVRGFRTSQIR